MDLRELRYFAAVFDERNLTRAAARCFVSQPSVSLAIANLETELGTALFIRHKKGMMPTDAAERFQPIARRIIGEADAARRLFREQAPRHVMKLGLMRTLDPAQVIALLKPLTARSDVSLHIVGVSEQADARIVSRSLVGSHDYFLPLWTERYVAALPPSHPLTLKERLRLADLKGVAMIDRCHCEQSDLFGKPALQREVAAIVETEDWALALVAAGVGVAIVPEGAARNRTDVIVREIELSVKRQVGLAYPVAGASEVLKILIAQLRPKPQRGDRPASPAKGRKVVKRGRRGGG